MIGSVPMSRSVLLSMIAVSWWTWNSCVSGPLSVGIPKPWGQCAFLLNWFGVCVHQALFSAAYLGLVWSFFSSFGMCWTTGSVCSQRLKHKQETTRSHIALGAFADLSKLKSWFNWCQEDFGAMSPGSGLGSTGGSPCRAAPQWQGEHGQSHLLAEKVTGNVYLSLGTGWGKNVSRPTLSWIWG